MIPISVHEPQLFLRIRKDTRAIFDTEITLPRLIQNLS